MYYGDADNDLEDALLFNVSEMKRGFKNGQRVNLILLFDRPSAGYGCYDRWGAFNENFNGARLYRVTSGKTLRLNGGEFFPEITEKSGYVDVNMGDALTLQKFIRFCKANFPAEKYALIFTNHGGGPKKKSSLSNSDDKPLYKELCSDYTSNDSLFTNEISSTLTSDESVDVLGIDACLMSSAEFAYQFRRDSTNSGFSAEILVASAFPIWSWGWDYRAILSRLKGGMTVRQFGMSIFNEEKYSGLTMTQMSCLDLAKVSAVKEAVDNLAKELPAYKTQTENIRGTLSSLNILHYFDAFELGERLYFPFFDLYALAEGIYNSTSFNTNTPVKEAALALMTAIDEFIVDSFMNEDPRDYGSSYPLKYPFKPGRNGVHIVFPDTASLNVNGGYITSAWSYTKTWYTYDNNSIRDIFGNILYNKDGDIIGTTGLDWCKPSGNGAGIVGNWLELLKDWYK